MHVTVVIPTYNEAENLPQLVSALFGLSIPGLSILVVDDNSPDGTGALAEELANRYAGKLSVLHRPEKQGLGRAYKDGFRTALQAGAEAVLQMDADFSHPPDLIPRMLAALSTCDVVLGSRYVPGGSVDERWPLWRKALSGFGNRYARIILGLPMRDVTGGYRLWRASALVSLPLERVQSNGYAFQVELAYLTNRLGYTYQEVPFYFADRRWGRSKMSLRIQREAAIRVWKMRFEYRDLAKP